jgi:hypothetical protein
MARYIDADAFEKFIKKKYKDGESTDDIKDQMLFDLSYQPTAYNVDAVVAEIKKHSYFMGIRESMVETIVRIVRKGSAHE